MVGTTKATKSTKNRSTAGKRSSKAALRERYVSRDLTQRKIFQPRASQKRLRFHSRSPFQRRKPLRRPASITARAEFSRHLGITSRERRPRATEGKICHHPRNFARRCAALHHTHSKENPERLTGFWPTGCRKVWLRGHTPLGDPPAKLRNFTHSASSISLMQARRTRTADACGVIGLPGPLFPPRRVPQSPDRNR